MTKNTALLMNLKAVIEALQGGRPVERRSFVDSDDEEESSEGPWTLWASAEFNTSSYEYRIKPSEAHVPYTYDSFSSYLASMKGSVWVKAKHGTNTYFVTQYLNSGIRSGHIFVTWQNLYENYTYQDGAICGVPNVDGTGKGVAWDVRADGSMCARVGEFVLDVVKTESGWAGIGVLNGVEIIRQKWSSSDKDRAVRRMEELASSKEVS